MIYIGVLLVLIQDQYLMDHVAFRMPVLIDAVPINIQKLLQYCRLASRTSDCKFDRIVIIAVYIIIVFVVRVVWSKDNRTGCTAKVPDVIFLAESSNV